MLDPGIRGCGMSAFQPVMAPQPHHRQQQAARVLTPCSDHDVLAQTHALEKLNVLEGPRHTQLGHAFGRPAGNVLSTQGLLSTLWAGGTVVLLPRFSASRFWPVSVAEKCTWAAMVPFCVRALAEQHVPSQHSYRAWGNAFWSAELETRYKLSIFGWWGMTEIITHGIAGDFSRPGHPMGIGRPALEYDVAIRRDDGSPIEVGETGHLFIRGRRGISIFAGYLDDPKATADSFDDRGFFKTGDLVTLHPDGFIQFADRAKDMLKVGGENVAASEIERVIQSVLGVREVAVVGKRHPMLQEVPVAYVVAALGDVEDLRGKIADICRVRLSEFKMPRDIRFVEELPRGLTEKVSKVELRRRANEDH